MLSQNQFVLLSSYQRIFDKKGKKGVHYIMGASSEGSASYSEEKNVDSSRISRRHQSEKKFRPKYQSKEFGKRIYQIVDDKICLSHITNNEL